jgi:GNAT superfamily N-acetyltransferase
MKAKCFDCGGFVEAGDVAGVENAFLAHAREQHKWPYPEDALRTYARNYAEALERLDGPTERLAEIGEVTVHPVSADRVDDWLRLFDRDGFPDNPDWGSCYCLEPHAPAPPENPERPWRETRATMIDRLKGGATFGYLAYVEGRPVGWVNASTRANYGLFEPVEAGGPEAGSIVGVSCFVIAPPYRGHRVASALLDRVIADAKARGAAWLEAYPRNQQAEGDAAHFRGARSMYEARGFAPVVVGERHTVMRRRVELR